MDRPGYYRVGCRSRPYVFMCEVCGEMFDTTRCTASLCGATCRQRISREIRRLRELVATDPAAAELLRTLIIRRRQAAAARDRGDHLAVVADMDRQQPTRPVPDRSSSLTRPPQARGERQGFDIRKCAGCGSPFDATGRDACPWCRRSFVIEPVEGTSKIPPTSSGRVRAGCCGTRVKKGGKGK